MGDSKIEPSGDDIETGLDQRLQELAPLMNLLDQAREAVVTPRSDAKSFLQVEPPSRLGDFDLLSPIGRGGMGVVYEARQRSLDRIVAVKVLPKAVLPESFVDSDVERTSRKNLVQRFHTEGRAAARLHHQNIVPVFGCGEAAGFYYFVMQRIYGQSLDRWIETHVVHESAEKLDEQQLSETVARFGQQAASGLAYAHQEGVLHRDIKPANLMIDEEGILQIADFGVARIDDASALTKTSDVVGTLRYMAPEQITGDSQPQSDVYSLGVTLYEMATGGPAVDDASVRHAILLQKRPRGPTPLAQARPALPLDLRTIIEKAMEPELGRRYVGAAELADDLERFLEGRSIRARRMPWWERSRRWVRRNQTVTLLASLLFVALTMTAVSSAVSQFRVGNALHDTVVAKRSVERTSEFATGALEEIFQRFSSTADSTSIDFDATTFSAPAVDPTTAALLEDLIGYYDTLAAQAGPEEDAVAGTSLRPGEARMHLGTIHQQLGDHAAAIAAYEKSLSELKSTDRLLRARIHNQIGIAFQMMGEEDQSKTAHASALEILSSMADRQRLPAVRFEAARSELLFARRLRPGMGPSSFPPEDAFRSDPWDLRPQRGRFPPRQRAASPESDDRKRFVAAVDQLLELRQEIPDSLPVTLLLSNLVRQSLSDVLRAQEQPFENAWLLDLADQLQSDFEAEMVLSRGQGNDAAIAYELVQLLSDFNVFREMPPPLMRQGLDRLEQAIPHAEYLVDHYPNVPAYENLAIHTFYKAATLRTAALAQANRLGKGPEAEAARSIRSLLRQALRSEIRLLERTTEGYGYSLWCSLFLMRIGDLQMRTRDRPGAIRSFRRALRFLPLESLAAQPRREGVGGASRRSLGDGNTTQTAAVTLLHRLARAVRPDDSDLASKTDRLARQFHDHEGQDWDALRVQMNEILNQQTN